MSGLFLLLALQVAGGPRPGAETGPLGASLAPAPSGYGALVDQAVQEARAGRLDDAEAALERAIRAEPARAEALVERGGVRFLQERYADAVVDLQAALRLGGEDAHARELLAASLHLLGREDEALASWNRLGGPRVAGVEITGLVHVRDEVARRELRFQPEGRLDLAGLRESRRRLYETGAFEQITVHTHPLGDGTADVEVALTERHGLGASAAEVAVAIAAPLADRRLALRYSGLGGTGAAVFGSWRFAENRPEVALGLDWPRPFGADLNLRVVARRGRQGYQFEEPVERRSRGLDLGARRVLGASTVGEWGVAFRDRAFSAATPSAPPGLVAGPQAGLERRLGEWGTGRVDGSLRAFASTPALGADLAFVRASAALRYEGEVPGGLGGRVVARGTFGAGTSGLPLDEGLGLGGGPESPFPLRAHRQFEDGVAGAAPLGRSLLLFNAEWRRPLASVGPVRVGLVVFHDSGRAWRGSGNDRWLHDGGVGLRLGLASTIVRIDFGHGWVDGANALTLGLGQAF